jgi:uncharacterized protein (TIGR02996 family)
MTTEDDFHRALDANPSDWQTRLVFADWLQERGDPRAEGYRALGVLRLTPRGHKHLGWTHTDNGILTRPNDSGRVYAPSALPVDWWKLVEGERSVLAPQWIYRVGYTRRRHDDAAAIGFAKLPAERRAELLKGGPVGQ